MLNYIWLSLVVIGIIVAVGHDVSDMSQDTYRNGKDIPLAILVDEDIQVRGPSHRVYHCNAVVNLNKIAEFYGVERSSEGNEATETLPATLTLGRQDRGRLLINVEKTSFDTWKEMAKLQGNNAQTLQGQVHITKIEERAISVNFQTDPIRFVTISKVSNEGIFRYAKIAVELAIGLIGIMAFWLGVMRIAEQSGLIAKLAQALKPITTWLFPDVPGDHPAMGAMIMNISANILGLSNAATPLGLKAMEELNKLNKKLGTATDAMCTFLVINTSNVQLIPATVIAIRAAAGSANPTEILGPAIVATTISTVVGVIAVKLLARLRFYKDQLRAESGEQGAKSNEQGAGN